MDPDCVFPTPASFSGTVYKASDLACASSPSSCPTCSYCSYPSQDPQCTTTAPTSTDFVVFNESNYMQASRQQAGRRGLSSRGLSSPVACRQHSSSG